MNEQMLTMSDGTPIHTVFLKPEGQPVAHIHLMHGMAEHIGRYEEFMKYLVGEGFAVSGHDHRGHGETVTLNGKLGYFGDTVGFDRLAEDAREIVRFFKEEFQTNNVILFGHSMGSFIGRRFVQNFGLEIDKLICSGTGGDPGVGLIGGQALAYMKSKALKSDEPDYFINKLVFGSFNKIVAKPKTPFDWLSTDTNTVEKYINDPLCGFVPTTGLFMQLFKGLEKINDPNRIRQIPSQLPILLLSGLDDPVGAKGKGVWQAARQFTEAGIDKVTVMLYEGGRHEMLQEKNREQVFDFIKEWSVK